jgi:predicted nucleotidyltransferase
MAHPHDSTTEGVDIDMISAYLDETDIIFAILFGSHARGEADASSDVDIALRFPDHMDALERFRERNRIDADLQEYVRGFADVSDIESLPTPVAYAALRDGILLTGDENAVERFRNRVEREYEVDANERTQERRSFIDRLARGET